MRLPLHKKIRTPDPLKTAVTLTAGSLMRVGKSPDEELGELFTLIQQSQVFPDGKTFVDMVPRKRMRAIREEYIVAREDPHFDLHEFVKRHFYEFIPDGSGAHLPHDPEPIEDHIERLWHDLRRRNRKSRGSLIALPYYYTVPGGRFSEQFYWDTYFIMLGLAVDGHWRDIELMMKNYTYMIRKFGFIPTANRSYFLSRSQPPFFARMVELLALHKGKRIYVEYLPYLLAEYSFWMKGKSKVAGMENGTYLRLVKMDDGTLLNRYYDNKSTPRPESLREDLETAHSLETSERLYLDLRAGAESGWDFSSRWFRDPADIQTIETTDIVPVDLNSMMYTLEKTIAHAYDVLKQSVLAKQFHTRAARRADAIEKYFWSEEQQFYGDYHMVEKIVLDRPTLAGVFPLYAGVASKEHAVKVAQIVERDFLKRGGLVTTLQNNGQQWDAPNGWAPLQWVAVKGLQQYEENGLAASITERWIETVERVYKSHHALIEKYDVVNEQGLGGGGEYALQEGFGWTNGVYQAFKKNL